jgi:RNA polymerase sigma-70 factor, ECF subfamily
MPGLAWVSTFRMDIFSPPVSEPSMATASPLQAWLERVAEQDEAAFKRLYEALSPRVYALAMRILRNAAHAEEVVEDCFWQIWRQAARFDPQRGSAEAWVLTLARSRALDAWRARDRTQEGLVSLDAMEEDGQPLPESDAHAAADGLLEASRSSRALHAALAQLPALPRQLVALAFLRGLTHEEITERTGLALGTVKSHIRRALAQLNTALQAERSAP